MILFAVLDGSLIVTLCINCRFICIYMNDIAPKSHTNHAAINSLSSERICEKQVTKQPIKQPIKRKKNSVLFLNVCICLIQFSMQFRLRSSNFTCALILAFAFEFAFLYLYNTHTHKTVLEYAAFVDET